MSFVYCMMPTALVAGNNNSHLPPLGKLFESLGFANHPTTTGSMCQMYNTVVFCRAIVQSILYSRIIVSSLGSENRKALARTMAFDECSLERTT